MKITFFLLCLLCTVLSGCATTRSGASRDFVRQWQTIHVGMTAPEVRRRLGPPYTSYTPTDGLEGRDLIEYWIFTRDWSDVPPPEGYVIHYHRRRVALLQTPPPHRQ